MTNQDYKSLNSQLRALLEGEADALAATSNFVALLYNAMPDINWLGVYVLRKDELVLGPFQGKPACAHIAFGDGVCGTAAATHLTQRIDDAHSFPGHIVCDAGSRSELVVPLLVAGDVIGVLDIDSPSLARFSESDRRGVEELCATFCQIQRTRGCFI